jgi:hypothetical protein
MRRRTKIAVATAAGVVVLGAAGTGIAVATGVNDDNHQTPITGPALARASAVALRETGGGRVTETEVGDEEGFYQVEVTLPDGHQVDVNLDEAFHVIKTNTDRETN